MKAVFAEHKYNNSDQNLVRNPEKFRQYINEKKKMKKKEQHFTYT